MDLETERLVIRDFVPEDAEDLQEILGDAEVMRCSEPPYCREQTVRFLEEFCIGKKAAAAVVHRAGGKLIGYLLFHEITTGVFEMGWFFNKAFWRQGYAYEACKAVIRHAFDDLGAHKIFAETTDITKAAGLMKKLGMTQEGSQRSHVKDNAGHWADLHLYGLLREEWDTKN